ncbi:MAG TPA: HAD hydrolase-like protein, partial [Acidothermaceae bacterium]
EQVGLKVVASADDQPAAVVQGYSPDLAYADLAETALAVRSGALWVATNVDSTLPSRRGLLPGNGSLVAAVALATGQRPVVAGKPELPLHAEGVTRTHAKNPLVVGDRLDTDIEGAFAADTDCLLVLTGVTRAADLVDAPIKHRPTYLALDLSGLIEPQPDVEWDGTVARCGRWVATATSSEIRVDGEGQALDGLRSLLTAAWAARPLEGVRVDASAALRQLGFG